MMTERWLENFEDVSAYIAEHKCTISDISDDAVTRHGTNMRTWVIDQRVAYYGKYGHTMSDECKEKLKSIGIEEYRDIYENAFCKILEDARAFYDEHHHVKFPSDLKSSNGTSMRSWLGALRRKYRCGELSNKYIQILQEAGMMFILENPYETAYRHALEFYQQYGSLQMPTKYVCEDGFALGKWCAAMRDRRKNGTVSEEHIAQLDKLGFDWSTDGQKRELPQKKTRPKKNVTLTERRIQIENENGIKNAKAYLAEHGDLNVPKDYVCKNRFRLGNWLATVCLRYRNHTLSEDVIQQLNELHFEWKLKSKPKPNDGRRSKLSDFEEGIRHAEEYAAVNHHLNVPIAYVCEDGFALGKWMQNIRIRHHQNNLLPEVIESLDNLGIDWSTKGRNWNRYYQACKEYIATHPGEELPTEQFDSFQLSLSKWFRVNYRKHKAGTLTPEQSALISELDYQPINRHMIRSKKRWNDNYEDVIEYLAQHPELSWADIPDDVYTRCQTNMKSWLMTQHLFLLNENSNLTSEQREKLLQIGMMHWPDTSKDRKWVNNCLEVKAFYEENGHLRLPKEMYQLKQWFLAQRGRLQKGKIIPERMKYLEENEMLELFQMDIRHSNKKATIELPRADYNRLSQMAANAGYKSVEEYLQELARGTNI